jgi:hypothetical protein
MKKNGARTLIKKKTVEITDRVVLDRRHPRDASIGTKMSKRSPTIVLTCLANYQSAAFGKAVRTRSIAAER